MTKLNDKQIAAYEAKGFNRWTKGKFDRLYINAKDLGAEISYYGTGNVRSAKWHDERVSNADGRRLLASKVYVDVNTGELHVDTSFDAPYDTPELEDAARAIMAEVEAETAEPEIVEEPEIATDEEAVEETTEDTKPVWSELQGAIVAAHEAVRALAGYGICGSEPELGSKVSALNAELNEWVRGMEVLAEQGAAHVDRASVMAASERRCEAIQNAIANGGGVFVADEDDEALKMYRKGDEYPQGGTDAEFVRRVTYKAIGNGYLSEVVDIWQLAESVISAADLLLADGMSVYDVSEVIHSHIKKIAVLYDVY